MANKFYIKYLPPVRFYIKLPQHYPSMNAPEYHLAINWLPPWETSLVCQKLDELWQQNNFNEILFIWVEFLFHLFLNPTNEFLLEVLKWTDIRVVYGGLHLNPIKKLLDYNKYGELLNFQINFHECGICFITYSGKMCLKINTCNHIFCKSCIVQFLTVKINERDVNNIKCPSFECKTHIKYNEIKEVCSSDILKKYENCLLEIELLKRRNLIYCPRKVCQTPVFVKEGENLASCPNCEYHFCAYCFKVYHGVMACNMDSGEKQKLINEYQNGDNKTKKFLEKKYGKNQIYQIVEKQLTNNYLKENTKVCPTCGIFTTKTSGCNLINCSHCHTNFCWICSFQIVSEDPYDHFKFVAKGLCAGRLFEGVDESNEIDNLIDNVNDAQNLEFIMMYDSE